MLPIYCTFKADNENKEAADWSVGAKDCSKAKLSEEKEAEKLRKAAEKLALNAADEESNSDIKKVAKTKKKGKDDFDLLNAAIAKMPKTKAMKDAEAKAIVDAERKKKDAEAREAKEARLKVRILPPLHFQICDGEVKNSFNIPIHKLLVNPLPVGRKRCRCKTGRPWYRYESYR